MAFDINQAIPLNGHTYRVTARIGGGAISEVYRALLDDDDACEVVLKCASALDGDAASGLGVEAATLRVLNTVEDTSWERYGEPRARWLRARETRAERLIVALLDSGTTADGRPFVVQELAPPEYRPERIHSLEDELRALTVAHALARALALCHGCGFTLRDFDPRAGKGDRIRVEWRDGALVHLKLIDWNVVGGPGTSSAELTRDLQMVAGHLFFFLCGSHVDLETVSDGKPAEPAPGWERITEGSRLILQRALQRDPQRGYRSATELAADLAWHIETLGLHSVADLRTRASLAQGRPDRMLAVADLALRRVDTGAERELFLRQQSQARAELTQAEERRLDRGIMLLRSDLFLRAAKEFDQQLADRSIPDEIAVRARVYRDQALVGLALDSRNAANSVTSAVVTRQLNRSVEALLAEQWQAAQDELDLALAADPTLANVAPFMALRQRAEAGGIVAAQPPNVAPGPLEPVGSLVELIAVRARQCDSLAPTVAALQHVAETLTPDDTRYRERYRHVLRLYQQSRGTLEQYRELARTLRAIERRVAGFEQAPPSPASRRDRLQIAAAQLTRAKAIATEIARHDDDPRSRTIVAEALAGAETTLRELHERVAEYERELAANDARFKHALQALHQGDYNLAASLLHQVRQVEPDHVRAVELLPVALQARRLAEHCRDLFDQATRSLDRRRPDDHWAIEGAESRLNHLLELHGRPLHHILELPPTPHAEHYTFTLAYASEAQRVLTACAAAQRAVAVTSASYADQNPDEIIAALEELQHQLQPIGRDLLPEEIARLYEARAEAVALREVQVSLDGPDTAEHVEAYIGRLHMLRERIAPFPGRRARSLLGRIEEAWLARLADESTLDIAHSLYRSAENNQGGVAPWSLAGSGEIRRHLESFDRLDALTSRSLSLDEAVLTQLEAQGQAVDIIGRLRLLAAAADVHPAVGVRAQELADRLGVMLAGALTQICEHAEREAVDGRYDAARALLVPLMRLLAGPPAREVVPRPLCDRVLSLGAAVVGRLRRQERLVPLLERLARQEITAREALEQAEWLSDPAHPTVRVDDIAVLVDMLRAVVAIELETAFADTADVQTLIRLQHLRREVDAGRGRLADSAQASPLEPPLATLAEQIEARIAAVADQLCTRLEQTSWRFGVEGMSLTIAYWSVVLLARTAPPQIARRAEAAITGARARVRAELPTIAHAFAATTSADELITFAARLERFARQNRDLAEVPPALTGAFPGDTAAVKPPLSPELLATWQSLVERLLGLDELLPPGGVGAEHARTVVLALRELLREFAELRGELGGLDPVETSERFEFTLETAASATLHRAETIDRADKLFRLGRFVEAFAALDEPLPMSNAPEERSRPLFASLQRTLDGAAEQLRFTLETAFGDWLVEPLGARPERMAEQLRERLGACTVQPALAARAVEFVCAAIAQHAAQAPSPLTPAAVERFLWGVVGTATAPVAGVPPETAAAHVAELQVLAVTELAPPPEPAASRPPLEPSQEPRLIAIDFRLGLAVLLLLGVLVALLLWLILALQAVSS